MLTRAHSLDGSQRLRRGAGYGRGGAHWSTALLAVLLFLYACEELLTMRRGNIALGHLRIRPNPSVIGVIVH